MAAQQKDISDARRRKIVEHYNKGIGMAKIAENIGCCVTVVRRILVEENVTIRGRGRPRNNA